jgi:Raf kinase inhibitor-like YbhB/YbcL family protein
MKLISTAFSDNSEIPQKYTCLGENINPPFEIQEAPENALSFILIVEDYDAGETPWVHWIVFNILKGEFKINENSVPHRAVAALNSSKTFEYDGPCPKTFESPHKIHFKVLALDSLFELAKESDKEMILRSIEGHVLEEAELIGLCSPRQEEH